ncbi:hypothetical protein O0I10_001450 [Lichtheimia ornata]|uniref:Putative zinc-finger domain-containing protein n=1 Tax=Lichtheimia ornata TaxID=688661 RepID=A0AAD7VCG9_9FUNG|nr:uncharacterized protein O0I10_001450 [Lichtheimia ornata]KAJ8662490.1 hypothetical protein O0I10_001450 [Lichtheimia ornata]
MAALQSPIDMDISDGSNSDMDVSESDQETESAPVKSLSSKQATTYTPIPPFTSSQYYPRPTSDAAMLSYAPGNQFGSNTQSMLTDTRTNMMNPFFFGGGGGGGGGYNQPISAKRSIHLNPYMANGGMESRDKNARWRQQQEQRTKSPKPTTATTLDQQQQQHLDDSDADSYYTATSDFEEDEEEPGLIKTDQDEMDGLQAELHRYKQEISTLDERLDEIGRKKQRLEQDVLRLRVHQSMKKNRKRVANQNTTTTTTTLDRHQSNSPSQATTTTAIPNPIKAKQEQQQQQQKQQKHITVSPISKTNHPAIQQPMPRPPAASTVPPSSPAVSVPPYKMQPPKVKPVVPPPVAPAPKPVNTNHTSFASHHRQWVAPYVATSSNTSSSQSPGKNANFMTIPPTSLSTRSPAAVTTPKTMTPPSVATPPKATSSSAAAATTAKVSPPEASSSAVKEAWLVESIPRAYAAPLRGPKEPPQVKEAHVKQPEASSSTAAAAPTSEAKRHKGTFKPYESPLTRLGIGSQKKALPMDRVKRGLCRFEAGGGTCNDDTCRDLHFRDLEGTSSSSH